MGQSFLMDFRVFLFEIPKTIWTASELSYVFRRQWWLRRMSMSIASHSNSEEHIFIYGNNQTNIRSHPLEKRTCCGTSYVEGLTSQNTRLSHLTLNIAIHCTLVCESKKHKYALYYSNCLIYFLYYIVLNKKNK